MVTIPLNKRLGSDDESNSNAFKNLVDKANDAIIVIGHNESVVYINEFGQKMIGYDRAKIINKMTLFDCVSGDQYLRVADILHRRMNGEITPNKYETKMKTASGAIVPIEITSSRTIWNGEPASMSIVRDISLHKKFEDEFYRIGEQYQDLTESRFDLFFRWVPDTILTYVSKSTAENFGVAEDELIGKKWLDLLESEMRGVFLEKVKKLLSEPKQTKEVLTFKQNDQSVVYECIFTPIFNRKGQLMEFQTSARNITSIRELRRSLSEYEALVKNAMDFIPGVSVQGFYTDGTVFYWNRASEEIFGYSANEAIGKNLADLIIPEDSQEQFRNMLEIGKKVELSGEFELPSEIDLRHKDGSSVPVYSIHTAVSRADSNPLLFCIDIDLTEKREYEVTIKKRLLFQSKIAKISSRFSGTENLDSVIDKTLKDIGDLTAASRSYLFQFRDRGRYMTNTHEWCKEGVKPAKESLQHIETGNDSWFVKQIEAGKPYHIRNVDDLPPEAETERQRYFRQDIKSLLIFPFSIQGELSGFIGLDNTHGISEWKEEDYMLLGTISELLAGALGRYQLEEKRKDALFKMQEAYQHLGVINRQISILLSVGRQEKFRESRKIAEFLIDSALGISQARCGALYSYDAENADFQMLGNQYTDDVDPLMPTVLRAEDHSFLQEVLRHHERVQLHSVKHDIHFFSKNEAVHFRLLLVLPIILKNKLLGLLVIGYDKRETVPPIETNFLEAFAMQASVLLHDVLNQAVKK